MIFLNNKSLYMHRCLLRVKFLHLMSTWCLHWRLGHLVMLPSSVLNLAANDVCFRSVLLAVSHLMILSIACLMMRWSKAKFWSLESGRPGVSEVCALCWCSPQSLKILLDHPILWYETCLAQWQPQSLTFFLSLFSISLRKETQAKREDFSNKGMRTNMEK